MICVANDWPERCVTVSVSGRLAGIFWKSSGLVVVPGSAWVRDVKWSACCAERLVSALAPSEDPELFCA